MIVAMLNVQYVMCNIHVATCLLRLDETCRTDEEVGMFGRIVLYIAIVVVDVKICWFQSINGYPIFSVVQLYA